MKAAYLFINLLTLVFPVLVWIFSKKVHFLQYLKFQLPALILTALPFILWDHFFVSLGVWYYRPEYILGSFVFGLPVEEILFFFTLQIAFTSLYEWLQGYLRHDYLLRYSRFISWLLLLGLVPIIATQSGHIYTAVTAVLAIFLLLFQVVVVRGHYMGRFYIAYLIAIIPFWMLRLIYTGLPVMIYQPDMSTGIDLATVPVEDMLYLLVFMQTNIILYEWLKSWTKERVVEPPDGEEKAEPN